MQVIDATGHIAYSPVLCLVEFHRHFEMLVLSFSHLALTPTHPLRIKEPFIRPCDLAKDYAELTSSRIVDRVFNVVLHDSHVLLCINCMEAVTLGHGFKQAFHPFYSTKQVLATLEQRSGWTNGHVIVSAQHPLRNQRDP